MCSAFVIVRISNALQADSAPLSSSISSICKDICWKYEDNRMSRGSLKNDSQMGRGKVFVY